MGSTGQNRAKSERGTLQLLPFFRAKFVPRKTACHILPDSFIKPSILIAIIRLFCFGQPWFPTPSIVFDLHSLNADCHRVRSDDRKWHMYLTAIDTFSCYRVVSVYSRICITPVNSLIPNCSPGMLIIFILIMGQTINSFIVRTRIPAQSPHLR